MQKKQVIFITGCASGIGKYLAETLYQLNYNLIITDIDLVGLQKLKEQNQWQDANVLVQSLNITKPNEWQEVIKLALEKWQKIDILINNAGVIRPGFIHETDFQNIDFQIDTNLKGTIYGTKLIVEQMVKQTFGHIINIASLAGITPGAGFNLYCASKFGVRGFSLSIAQELKKYNIQVTVVCPDLIATPMLDLQLNYPESALVFSGGRAYSVEEIGQVIIKKGIQKKQLEILFPFKRGLLAKIVSFKPSIANFLIKSYIRKGLQTQEKMKKK